MSRTAQVLYCLEVAVTGGTRLVLCLWLWLVPLVEVGAQGAEVQAGARIRLRAPGVITGRAVGIVVARAADSLTFVREGAAPRTLALGSITRLEMSRGKSRALGLRRGAAFGAAIGLVVGAGGYDESSCESFGPCSRGSAAATGAFVGAILGAGVGAAIGVERWERVALSVGAPALRTGGGGLAVAVTVH